MIKVHITQEAYLKLKYYIEACPIEISGLGKVREVERTFMMDVEDTAAPAGWNFWSKKKRKKYRRIFGFKPTPTQQKRVTQTVYEVYDIECLPQTATGSHASISPEVLAQFMHEKMRKGGSLKEYKVWWHSHVNFEAFFSGIDTGTIDGATEFPYLISIVGNKRGHFLTRFDTYEPRVTEHPTLEVVWPNSEKIKKQCYADVSKMVTEVKYNWNTKEYAVEEEPADEHEPVSLEAQAPEQRRFGFGSDYHDNYINNDYYPNRSEYKRGNFPRHSAHTSHPANDNLDYEGRNHEINRTLL